jgi:hypothetical protein
MKETQHTTAPDFSLEFDKENWGTITNNTTPSSIYNLEWLTTK